MNNIVNFFKGIAIGAGAILPGISSGVLCVIMGIYETLLDKVLNVFRDFKNNIKYLLPIGLGAICGIVLFGNILKYLFNEYLFQTSYIFIGLILGSIPILFKQINSKSKFRLHYILYMLFAFALGMLMVYLEKQVITTENINFSFVYLILSGMAMSIGVIVPGVSSTVILMLFGVYSVYLSAVATVYFPVLIPIGIGLILGSIICMKITKILLNNFYAQTFYAIIGFTLGSILILYPGFTFNLDGLIGILCVILGIIIANLFNKSE